MLGCTKQEWVDVYLCACRLLCRTCHLAAACNVAAVAPPPVAEHDTCVASSGGHVVGFNLPTHTRQSGYHAIPDSTAQGYGLI